MMPHRIRFSTDDCGYRPRLPQSVRIFTYLLTARENP